MSPLRFPPCGRSGRRSLVLVLVVTLLVSAGQAGAAATTADAADGVGTDRATVTVDGLLASGLHGIGPAGDLLGQVDPDDEDDEEGGDDDEEDDDDENEEDDDDEGGDDDDEEDEEAEDDEGDDEEDNEEDDEQGDADDGSDDGGPPFGNGPSEGDGPPYGEGPPDGNGPPSGDGSTDESAVEELVETVLTGVGGGSDEDPSEGPPDDGGEGPPTDEEAGGPDEDQGAGEASRSPASGGPGASSPSQVEEPTPTRTPEPAQLRVEDVSANRSVVTEGEPVRITATVVNDGEASGSRDVRLNLFGEVVEVRSVTVPGDDAREVTFDRTIEAPGTYEAAVGDASTTITVEPGDSTPESVVGPVSQPMPGFTALVALLGVIVAVLFVRLRG